VKKFSRLKQILREIGPNALAVSGGIDSLPLECVACDLNESSVVFHAVSPAVPKAATERVRQFAGERGWQLRILNSGEFGDHHYRSNPVNRCYFCKVNLYSSITNLTTLPMLSGTNLDDLDDFRPGLSAAENHKVRHPFVEAQITKSEIREIARHLDLGEISELPAAPCLSSRVQTGIRIEAEQLDAIGRVEARIGASLTNTDVRCRLSDKGYRLEVARDVLEKMRPADVEALLSAVREERGPQKSLLGISPYVRGSAFTR
jgi:uncharacterized protein